jgi:tetratricopeptide (TPR) repeat protein
MANDTIFSGSRSFAGRTFEILALAILFATCGTASYGQSAPPAQSQPPAQQPSQQSDDHLPPRPARGASPADDSGQESSSKKDPLPDTPADSSSSSTSKKDPIPESAADQPKSKGAKPGVLPPEDDPAWDPFHAQQDVEVGEFYLHKGDLDAAIERFEDAVKLRANFAKPRLLLAETYEKKGDKQEAVRYYKEYLQVLPGAPDAKKVKEKIEKLSSAKK